jgi:DNA-binding MarR family transcriptional regulator
LARALDFLGDLRPAFVAHLAERLTDALCASTQHLAEGAGLKSPSRAHSVLLFLLLRGPASLTEMARTDGQSHQLLAARLDPLEKLGLIERFVDQHDARRRPYQLTRSGRKEALVVRANIEAHARAMEGLSVEIGVDLVTVLDDALEALRKKPMEERIVALPTRKRRSA